MSVRIYLFEFGLEGAREIRHRKNAAAKFLWSVLNARSCG